MFLLLFCLFVCFKYKDCCKLNARLHSNILFASSNSIKNYISYNASFKESFTQTLFRLCLHIWTLFRLSLRAETHSAYNTLFWTALLLQTFILSCSITYLYLVRLK